MNKSINLHVWRLYSSERVQLYSFSGEIVQDPDLTFYAQHSHLSCCQGRERGRNFTPIRGLLLSSRMTLIIPCVRSLWTHNTFHAGQHEVMALWLSCCKTCRNTRPEKNTAWSIRSISVLEHAVIATLQSLRQSELKSRLQKPICLVLTAHKHVFLYPARQRERRKKCILKNWFDVDRQSRINPSCNAAYLRAHTLQESVKRKECLSFCPSVSFCIFPTLWAQLRACSFLIIQKRTVWNMLSSPVRKMQVENNAGSLRSGLGNKIGKPGKCDAVFWFWIKWLDSCHFEWWKELIICEEDVAIAYDFERKSLKSI